MYKDVISASIKKYGSRCRIIPSSGGEPYSAYGFINPLHYRSKISIGGQVLPDGALDGGYHLFVGEAKCRLEQLAYGSVIERGGQRYVITHAESYYFAGEIIYSWATVRILQEGAANG